MTTGERYRQLPSVDKILAHQKIRDLLLIYGRDSVVSLVRRQLRESRQAIADGQAAVHLSALVDNIAKLARKDWQPWPRRVINATGVILHTNLGRAPLSADATQAALDAAKGYISLEFDLSQGKRGPRQAPVSSLLCQLTGAEAALVVNNNAFAMLLALTALAHEKEVVISRGEAVEIGGGFRIPEVMAQSGASLVEVGTTNRTYITDYEQAVTKGTAAFLKIHASNFRISGFTQEASIHDLVALGRRRGIPVFHDLGSGCLLESAQFGLTHEPMPQESIAAGCDLAFFSGDKLLGGPQAGIIVGREELVQRLQRNPLARALRIDKMSLAALTVTLLHYLKDEATLAIPIWRMISSPTAMLKQRVQRWKRAIGDGATVMKGSSTIGGGSLPGETLPTWLLALNPAGVSSGAESLAKRLRENDPPIIGRIEDEKVLLDPRTVLPQEEKELQRGLREAMGDQVLA